MITIRKTTALALIAALLGLSACTGGEPSMAAYSYVPSSKVITVATPQSLEDF